MTLADSDLPATMCGVAVHERVGRRIVGLADIAAGARDRGTQDEKIEGGVLCGAVQVDQTADFRRQHVRHLLRGLADHEIVLDDTGAVDHAVEPAVAIDDILRKRSDLPGVRHIQTAIYDLRRRASQPRDLRFPIGAQGGAACQDDGCGAYAPRDLVREDQPQPSGPTRDQINAMILPGECLRAGIPERHRALCGSQSHLGPCEDFSPFTSIPNLAIFLCSGIRAELRDQVGSRHITFQRDDLARQPRGLETRTSHQATERRQQSAAFFIGGQRNLHEDVVPGLIPEDRLQYAEHLLCCRSHVPGQIAGHYV